MSLQAGVDMKTVSNALGHSSFRAVATATRGARLERSGAQCKYKCESNIRILPNALSSECGYRLTKLQP